MLQEFIKKWGAGERENWIAWQGPTRDAKFIMDYYSLQSEAVLESKGVTKSVEPKQAGKKSVEPKQADEKEVEKECGRLREKPGWQAIVIEISASLLKDGEPELSGRREPFRRHAFIQSFKGFTFFYATSG